MLSEAEQKIIFDEYQHGNSPQAIARTHRCSVEDVLHIIGEDEMTSVQTIGDQIDQSEAGTTPVDYNGRTHRIPFDLN